MLQALPPWPPAYSEQWQQRGFFWNKVAYWAENVAGLTKDEIARIRANLVNAPGAAKAADL